MKIHPVQSDCDPHNPEQHAAWCWAAGIPDPSPSRPTPIPLIGPMLTAGVSKMLWDFGFRWHREFQTVWVDGVAGLGTIAAFTDVEPVEPDLGGSAEDFLLANNPDLLNSIRNANPDERKVLIGQLEKSFGQLEKLIETLKEG